MMYCRRCSLRTDGVVMRPAYANLHTNEKQSTCNVIDSATDTLPLSAARVKSLCSDAVNFTPAGLFTASATGAGSGVVRIDPLRFLTRCRKRRLNQALSVLFLSLGFF